MANQFLKSFSIHTIVWFLAFNFYSIMRQFGQDVVDEPNLEVDEFVLVYLFLAIVSGLVFGTIDTFLPDSFSRRTSFGKTVLLRSSLYFLIFVFLTSLGILRVFLF